VITRTFAAPRERVFAAWTEPEQFSRWFGPRDCTVLVRAMDVRPGGALHFCHRFPGEDVWVAGVYREVDAPRRLVIATHFSDPAGGRVERAGFPLGMREAVMTVTFTEREGGTEVVVRHAGLVADQGEGQGWTETLDRLGEHVAAAPGPASAVRPEGPTSPTTFDAPAGEPVIVMSRTFAAPRELVWRAFTEPEHVARWWGPRRYTNRVLEMDVRPGGRWRVEQEGTDGAVHRFKGVYREVVEPERLVKTFIYEDDAGTLEDRPVVETHTFEERDGATKLTIVSRFGSLADRDWMAASGMEGGARESLDRLAELLETL
jgi:uncharacterized protein YndB with AHSA1/START domain